MVEIFHPEQQGRIFSVMDGVRDLNLDDDIEYVSAPKAELDDLARVHSRKYLTDLETFCRQGGGDLDPDTYAQADSFGAARRAVGGGLEAIASLERRGDGVAFIAVRPPGHHAEADRAMGFCLLNNVAVSAAALVARGQRVLIIDWDVHHGNGTQSIFWDEPDVLYVSTHQWPLFPGTGKAEEVGGPNAVGLTVNVPLPRGATGDVVRCAFDEVAQPAIDRFLPDWVLVSCGFDAHRADPLGELALSTGDLPSWHASSDRLPLARAGWPSSSRAATTQERFVRLSQPFSGRFLRCPRRSSHPRPVVPAARLSVSSGPFETERPTDSDQGVGREEANDGPNGRHRSRVRRLKGRPSRSAVGGECRRGHRCSAEGGARRRPAGTRWNISSGIAWHRTRTLRSRSLSGRD